MNMNTIKVTVAKCGTNYAASLSDNVPGAVVFTADTYEEIQQNAQEVLKFHVEDMIADGGDVPDWLRIGDYKFEYNIINKTDQMKEAMQNQTNKEQMREDILKEFSAQGELVKGLGDALMHITLAGHFNEDGEWQEPEWKKKVLYDVAQARALIQKLYEAGMETQK